MQGGIEPFGETPDGPAHRILLDRDGLSASLLTWGATVQDLRLRGIDYPLVLVSPTLEPYLGAMREFGAIVGRYANRIGGAEFVIDGRVSRLDRNWRGRHTLHGGAKGASRRIWTVADVAADRAVLSLVIDDGDMGFPGTMKVQATFELSGGALRIGIEARADAPTPCSFAHHSYFNLDHAPTIDGHHLEIAAQAVLPVDADLIPLGHIAPVAETSFDFRRPAALAGKVLDCNFCLEDTQDVRIVAKLSAPRSGLGLTVRSDAPGLQVYTGDNIAVDAPAGSSGRGYRPRAGVALETQAWPDAPNHPDFPEAVLRPGEVYRHRVSYEFERLRIPSQS